MTLTHLEVMEEYIPKAKHAGDCLGDWMDDIRGLIEQDNSNQVLGCH